MELFWTEYLKLLILNINIINIKNQLLNIAEY